jgi:hypothetical protein
MYVAETWDEYRGHMRNQKDELLSHLDDSTYYGEVEDHLLNMWIDYQAERSEARENQE